MSKSILPPIDTPNSCSECDFTKIVCKEAKIGIDRVAVKVCSSNEDLIIPLLDNDFIHPQCPLQDTTELLGVIKSKLNELEDTGAIKELIPTLNKLYKALGGKQDE